MTSLWHLSLTWLGVKKDGGDETRGYVCLFSDDLLEKTKKNVL